MKSDREQPLPRDEIHLWLTYTTDIPDRSMDMLYRGLLDEAERRREHSFRFSQHRRVFLTTRALARTVLSGYMGVDPAACRFSQNEFGCPQLVNRQALETDLRFNIAHSEKLIVLAVCKGRDIGVDAEHLYARRACLDIARSYFSPIEAAELSRCPEWQRQYRFFEYWTFKEAYIKARRKGLSLPLDKFGFTYPNRDTVAFSADPDLDSEPSRWLFWQFSPHPEYVVALCVERDESSGSRIEAFQSIPLLRQARYTLRFLRTSENVFEELPQLVEQAAAGM